MTAGEINQTCKENEGAELQDEENKRRCIRGSDKSKNVKTTIL